MACLVSRRLIAHGHRVVVIGTEAEKHIQGGLQDFETEPLFWRDSKRIRAELTDADIVVYQIGNSYEYHRGVLEWIDRVPGIICLHDFFVGHLFYEWAKDHREEAVRVLGHWYGGEVAGRYFLIDSSEQFIETTSKIAPMTEWICSKGLAVATHSAWDCERVLRSCPGPVFVTPLAFELPISDLSDKKKSEEGPRFKILTFGHINKNKRVDSVIRALGQNLKLRLHSQYRLVGRIEEFRIKSFVKPSASARGRSRRIR